MKFDQLFEDVEVLNSNADLAQMEANNISINSEEVKPGDLFVCLKGVNFDGHDFAQEAVQKGAKIVVTEKDLGLSEQVIVPDSRSAYALLCRNFFKKACEKLKIVAITGTNGKTSISQICGQMFEKLGRRVGVIGTLGAFYDGVQKEVGLTTPDPWTLHQTLFEMAKAGVEYVFMEASAHALALKKLDGIKFESAVLTNITQDHLDFFGDMNEYAKAKLSLFHPKHIKKGIVFAEDKYGKSLANDPTMQIPIFSYGFDERLDCQALYPKYSMDGSTFFVDMLGLATKVESKLVGKFNVENLLACLLAGQLEGLDLNQMCEAIKDIAPIEGRFNCISKNGINVVIDYAHTPDGLENLLKTARQVTSGRLITLFGCGGNRDKTKRPIMGDIASRHSNLCILTSDNPRFEEPLEIIKQIEKGVKGDYKICENRAEAIKLGLSLCHSGDTLVIAGKGAEKYQEINGQKLPFSDKEQVYNYFSLRKDKAGEEND